MLKIYDTTLRDGSQQEGISYSTEDKINITKQLDKLGVNYIEGGWPGSNPKDIEYFKRVQDLELKNAKVTAFGSTRRANLTPHEDKNLNAILDSGVEVATIFGKAWNLHVTDALETSLEENLRMVESSVSYLKEEGLEVHFDAEHFFDGYKADADYALKVLQAAQRGGADSLVLCDTNGGSMPFEIRSIIKQIESQLTTPLGIHAHNDSDVAVANSLIAVESGVKQIQGTLNGYGERCGNANLSSIIPNLKLKYNYNLEIDDKQLKYLTEVSRYASEVANLTPPTHQPYVGDSAFAHKGGIHVSAILKEPETYEHIEPELVGNKRNVLVSELSGKSNLIYKAEELGIKLNQETTDLRQVLEQIKELEHQGYHFEGAEASFELLIAKATGTYNKLFELEGVRIITEKRGELAPVSEATIKVRIDGQRVHTAAEGNGPVNALDSALRKALVRFYPCLKEIHLIDYKVRVLDGNDGTEAKVRVLIESGDGHNTWGTVGASTNIIEASWQALVDSIEYGVRLKKQ
ncbi:2-isopropylmalate synthase/homocitrate synthase family protein [Halobacteroides halobius DSM 5150]|uniref:Citramalate synthase n=1 Tax=Halobacteroides halobius (strain ATCC 35273 / DSM 5150 / MD-1) TaxID=748449 RepID=L0K4R8_HALHC|nr:citramalate synthase [Halobacteroides halobius]AGB40262.1 2-isopropylmalate synthase/homocitrate synthase family protein [Halobacteroides halobius DSM 5150]